VTGPALSVVLLALLAGPPGSGAPPSPLVPQTDSLIASARRAAAAWQRHDFGALVAGSPGVMIRLGGAEPSAPVGRAQAAQTLESFAGGAVEISLEVLSVREVDGARAFTEVERTYAARGAGARQVQTLYFGWRREGGGYRLVEVRLVP
jgi:hypothetical protein